MIDFKKDLYFFYKDWKELTAKLKDKEIKAQVYEYLRFCVKYQLTTPYDYIRFICQNADYNDPNMIVYLIELQTAMEGSIVDNLNALKAISLTLDNE